MGLDNLVSQGKDLLNSEKAEQVTDDLLDKAAALADQKTGGKYADRIDQAVAEVDKRIGTK